METYKIVKKQIIENKKNSEYLKQYKKETDVNNAFFKKSAINFRYPPDAILSESQINEAIENFCDVKKSFYQADLYDCLQKSLYYLEHNHVPKPQKNILTKQLPELANIFFDVLNSEKDTYWRHNIQLEESAMELGVHEVDYISDETEKFTKKYFDAELKRITKGIEKLFETELSNDYGLDFNSYRIKVAMKFADGTIYNLYKDGKGLKGRELYKAVFEDELQNITEKKEKDDFINNVRQYIFHSSDENPNEKKPSNNLFHVNDDINPKTKDNKKMWDNIIKYMRNNGKELNNVFLEKYNILFK